jgi:pimeloyl-ACP methyl ester carboxylesterase
MLNYLEYGTASGNRPSLIIAHGLFGSGRNWGVIAKRLADSRHVITPDMRNHGTSPRASTQSYRDMAGDLAELIEAVGGPVDLCGHSMGGKTAMTLALLRPELIRTLIVADIAPVAYSHTQSMFIDAMRQVDLATLTRRSEAEAQLAAAGVEPALQSFFTQSLDVPNKAWRLNLDVLEAEMPKITATGSNPISRPRVSPGCRVRATGCTLKSHANSRPRCALFSIRRARRPLDPLAFRDKKLTFGGEEHEERSCGSLCMKR